MSAAGWYVAWVGAGMALGALFFAGLWWTVRRAVSSCRPALWLMAGFVVRSGFLLAGFYALAGRNGLHWLLLSVGFVLAQVVSGWWGKQRMIQAVPDGVQDGLPPCS